MEDSNLENLKAQLKANMDQLAASKVNMEAAMKSIQNNMVNMPKEIDKKIKDGMKATLMSGGKIILELSTDADALAYFNKL